MKGLSENDIEKVYFLLKNRVIHPSGSWDSDGRWFAKHSDLISVGTPSLRWPYKEMQNCRKRDYVLKVAKRFNCKTIEELKRNI